MRFIFKAKKADSDIPTLHPDMVKKPDYDHLVHGTTHEDKASILKQGFKTGTNPAVMNGIYTRRHGEEDKKDSPAWVHIHTKKDARVADLGTEKAMHLLHGFGNNHYHKVYHHIMKKMGYPVKEEHAGKDPVKYYDQNAQHIQDMSRNRRKEFYNHFHEVMKHNKIDVVNNGAEHIIVNPKAIEKIHGGDNMKKSRAFTQQDADIESWNEFFREGGELNTPEGRDMKRHQELKELYKKVSNYQNRLLLGS